MKKYKNFLKILEQSNYIVSLYELNNLIKKIFDDNKVSSVKIVHDKVKNGYSLIVTINNLFYEKTNIIYTKLIFNINDDKTKLRNDHFYYLYDINCIFKKVKFGDSIDLESKLKDIFDNKKFGDDIIKLSDLNVKLTILVNEWLEKENINSVSLFGINYNPMVDNIPCDSMSFNFDININDTRIIKMLIRKINTDEFKITFSENDWFYDTSTNDLESIPQTIGEMVKNYIL
jgi:hypothetical protein